MRVCASRMRDTAAALFKTGLTCLRRAAALYVSLTLLGHVILDLVCSLGYYQLKFELLIYA